jgi:hypothetical protein
MSSLAFPQLSTGAITQYPIQKTRSLHAVVNTLEDGSSISYLDPTSGNIRWDMRLSAISLAEMQAIQALFNTSYGPWSGFVFLDPTDNLLTASANLLNSSWEAPTGLAVVAGASDPFGGTAAFTLTNGSQTAAALMQALSSPATYVYTFSVYLCASTVASVVLVSQSPSERVSQTFQIGPAWTRVTASLPLTAVSNTWSLGIQLQPGQQVRVFGPQVDAQPSASSYRQTTGAGGIYADTHWALDALAFAITGPNEFSTQITLESYWGN